MKRVKMKRRKMTEDYKTATDEVFILKFYSLKIIYFINNFMIYISVFRGNNS